MNKYKVGERLVRNQNNLPDATFPVKHFEIVNVGIYSYDVLFIETKQIVANIEFNVIDYHADLDLEYYRENKLDIILNGKEI